MRRRGATTFRRRGRSSAADRVWIGFLHLVPLGDESVLEGGDGAYGYVAARVPDQARFLRVTGRAARRNGLAIDAVEWVEPATSLPAEHRGGGELQELVAAARGSGRSVSWAPLHAYSAVEDDPSG